MAPNRALLMSLCILAWTMQSACGTTASKKQGQGPRPSGTISEAIKQAKAHHQSIASMLVNVEYAASLVSKLAPERER